MRKAMACVLGVALALIVGAGVRQAFAQEAGFEAPLTNDDVVKLAKLGLGDDVIIAKINQAKRVDFKTGTDDLIKLKESGVSQGILAAMINRSGGGAGGGGAAGGTVVKLKTSSGTVDLTAIRGNPAQIVAPFVGFRHFMQYREALASVRTKDRKVTVLVESDENPQGTYWLVPVDSDDDDNDRSVSLQGAGMYGGKISNEPDDDDVVECEVSQVQAGVWSYTPKKDLKPGEYGLYNMDGRLYDFGVDKK